MSCHLGNSFDCQFLLERPRLVLWWRTCLYSAMQSPLLISQLHSAQQFCIYKILTKTTQYSHAGCSHAEVYYLGFYFSLGTKCSWCTILSHKIRPFQADFWVAQRNGKQKIFSALYQNIMTLQFFLKLIRERILVDLADQEQNLPHVDCPKAAAVLFGQVCSKACNQ